MIDDNRRILSDDELLSNGLDDLAMAASAFYELETESGKILAVMADCLIRCANSVLQGLDPRIENEMQAYESEKL